MKIDGSCYCGGVTYTADIDPEAITICHCTDCQTLSGSAFRTLAFAGERDFSLSGVPKTYFKTSATGNGRLLYFCAECGTPICSSSLGDEPKTYAIRVGTIRQRAELTPRLQIWFRSSLPWICELASIPAFQMEVSSDARGEAE